ncbi:protein HIGH CHLOROPHYLL FLUORESCENCE PHENOTYPE 173, chloroplastic isoform X1 [Prosopis cineraria]|uniref:protein HIGH CHLOROPHYLL FLUORESCENCE PHENOTYPE 173, chloroplastic isoform X1 n=1 Tax=Prosopis cineraria TaxID=364024 RepID=UPI00240FB56C|nr:protein HIGH CHLOROPHYLL FLUORESCENCE PHENOTYPE 173, chloroplastic isoform X1 [Prosopis cineraria]XP_054780338.1 protein HIGH CHLOROPHYLL FLUORESCENCE PHENOTYPE 173, chloroplastic isoform X1 [Prosopis cineraria]XP_054780339.1 protein HIGH CHLOROPHYLL FLUORESCENCE PHENOTYPE 173, chloroplastic isoform X1 [Prosopis cineraria]
MSSISSATTASSSFSSNSVYRLSKCRLSSDLLGSISFPRIKWDHSFRRCHTSSELKSRFLLAPRAAAPDTSKESKSENAQDGDDGGDEIQQTQKQQSPPPPVSIRLDDVNPVGLGRKSRQLFDEVWRKFSGLGQISRTIRADDKDALDALLIREGPMCEFAIPGAQNTVVLVVGATSRIGRIVVRKLMLRGYTVKALVRNADPEVVDMLPRSVEIVTGDVGDPSTLQAAVEGCNKIIYCATARSPITADLFRVDYRGVYNLAKAFQDYNNKLAQLRAGKSSKSKLLIAKFKSPDSLNGWEVHQGTYFQDVIATKYDGGMDSKFEFTETGEAVFSGYVFTRGGYVELSKKLSLPLGRTLDRYEGLVLSVGGNGRSYVLILEAGPSADLSQSKLYFARISTKVGFCRVRVPFSSFRPVKPDDPPLDPFLVHTLTIRFEPRRQRPVDVPTAKSQDLRSFKLIMEYIKALPTGQETDFVLVSCSGMGIESSRREQVLKAKQAGEDSLRRSGLGYTIVRPGPLKEEPGGQRALIFDQGNRISQEISCADVADICVKALHDLTARNKSFDVCYEYVAEEGRELYELVAHLPDKANNYLTPALSVLEKNT